MSSLLYEILACICEAYISGFFLLNLLNPKKNRWTTFLLWSVMVVPVMLVNFEYSVIRIIAVALLELGLVCVLYDDKFKNKLQKYITKQILVVFSSVVSFFIYSCVSDQEILVLRRFTEQNGTCFLLYLLLFSISTSITHQFVKDQKGAELSWVVGTQICIGIGECTAVLAVTSDSSGVIDAKRSWLIIISTVFMIVANTSVGSFASYLLDREFRSQNIDFSKEISCMEYKYYEMSVENDKKIRAIKHDISNQIQTVYSLFKNGEEKKGFEMIDQLMDRYSSIDRIMYCENPVVNIILTNKKYDAEEKGIETLIRVKESLNSIPVSDYDLSTIICNLLDNAVEGCVISEHTKPRIVVEILCKNQYLVIRVLNSCKVSMNIEDTDSIDTTKTGSQNHGIGMSIVAGIAKKYRGDFVVSAKNGMFVATVVLSMK